MRFAIFAFVCLFATQANAALSFKNKLLNEVQVNTIKGFIYEAYITQTLKEQKATLQKMGSAIDRVAELHKSEKVYEISSLKASEKNTPLVMAVGYIVQMVRGPTDQHIKEHYLQFWADRGSKVRTVFKNKKGKKIYSAIFIEKKRRKLEENENNKK